MSRLVTVVLLCLVAAPSGADAANKVESRLENAGVVLEEIYARRISAHSIVTGADVAVPAAGRRLVDTLEKNAPRNESQAPSSH